jgi:hypothetical protein
MTISSVLVEYIFCINSEFSKIFFRNIWFLHSSSIIIVLHLNVCFYLFRCQRSTAVCGRTPVSVRCGLQYDEPLAGAANQDHLAGIERAQRVPRDSVADVHHSRRLLAVLEQGMVPLTGIENGREESER